MDWLQKAMSPVRRLWFSVSSRLKARKNGAGLLKLHDDVQTCEYEDVQVMWEMLRRSEPELNAAANNNPKRKQQRLALWRVFVWSSSNTSSCKPN